jgi:uncharacterized protein involved in tolerance to divalent cations
VAGGLITSGESQYWWLNKRVRKIYFNISVWTIGSNRARIISEVQAVHKDKVPMIAFFKVDRANQEFLDWILNNL